MQQFKKGDIILNAKQTASLLNDGKAPGVGRAYASGTVPNAKVLSSAHANYPYGGTTGAFKGGQANTTYGINTANGTYSGATDAVNNYTDAINDNTEAAEENKEVFDWIEVKIARIEEKINELSTKAQSIYRVWTERNANLVKQIAKVTEEIDIQRKGYLRYIEEANSVGLDEEWAVKVREGLIDIEKITDQDLAENIKEYQEWYEKALACNDAVLTLTETLSELHNQAFENVATEYDSILAVIQHEQAVLEEHINRTETMGYIASAKYYERLAENQKSQITELEQERLKLLASMANAVNTGAIKEGSQAWSDMVNSINDVTQSIETGKTTLIEYNNSIQEIKNNLFDMALNRMSLAKDESDFLIDLLSNGKLFTDAGQFTNAGTATLGLRGINYDALMYQADEYGKEVKEVNKALANDPNNTKLLERRDDLLKKQQDMILAAEKEKESIASLVKEGMDAEASALQDLIDSYVDALKAQKDLYDFQKKVKQQTNEIAAARKKLMAYSGDTSEETKAIVQRLKVELEESEDNLEETEYSKYIEDQNQLLSGIYDDYKATLDAMQEDVDNLVSNILTAINQNAGDIATTIDTSADKVGYTVMNGLQDMLAQAREESTSSTTMRLSSMNNVVSQLIANGEINRESSDKILSALAHGDEEAAINTMKTITELMNNGVITRDTSKELLTALTQGNIDANRGAIDTISALQENGVITDSQVDKMLAALITANESDLINTQNIMSELIENGKLSLDDSASILNALTNMGISEAQGIMQIVNSLVQSDKISGEETDRLLGAIIVGNENDIAKTNEVIARLVKNSDLNAEEVAELLSSLSDIETGDALNTAKLIDELAANNQVTTFELKNIFGALLTGNDNALNDTQKLLDKLTTEGEISHDDAVSFMSTIDALRRSNAGIVGDYGQNFANQLTNVNDVLTEMKDLIHSIYLDLHIDNAADKAAPSTDTQPHKDDKPSGTQTSHGGNTSSGSNTSSTGATTNPVPANTGNATPTNTNTTPNKTTNGSRTEQEKYGVALAIWEGIYGWGSGDDRKTKLESKGFKYDEIQSIVNKIGKDGYIFTDAWKGKYYGITDLAPYHFNKFRLGKRTIGCDQLALTQENGREFIVRPSDGAILTPLAKGDSVLNAEATKNIWSMANNPNGFINQFMPNIPETRITTSNNTIDNINITLSLPNVTDYESLKYQLQHDKSFENIIKSMTVDKLFGGSSLSKYK